MKDVIYLIFIEILVVLLFLVRRWDVGTLMIIHFMSFINKQAHR